MVGCESLSPPSAGSTLPHLWPTCWSEIFVPFCFGAILLLMPFELPMFHTPCHLVHRFSRCQYLLGCFRLSPSCPFRLLHTALLSRPARRCPRSRIRRSSSERRGDFNPPTLALPAPATTAAELRYESDLTDAEWAEIAPLIPPAKPRIIKHQVDVREVVNGIMYILSTGCQWRDPEGPGAALDALRYDRWSCDGTLEQIHDALYVKCREHASREASPTAAIIDSQSVKSAEKEGAARPTWLRSGQEDQGQEAAYACRFTGLLMHAMVTRQTSGSRRRCNADDHFCLAPSRS